MKVIAIGGEPAVGKSTLVRKVLAMLEPSHGFSYGRLKGHLVRAENLWIFGVYAEGQVFPGTDRLSMSVQPDANAFLQAMARDPAKLVAAYSLQSGHVPKHKPTILFEGDRLVNGKFVQECQKHTKDVRLMVLETTPERKGARHAERKDNQGASFLQAKATKTANLLLQYEHLAERHEHATPADTERLAALILARVRRID